MPAPGQVLQPPAPAADIPAPGQSAPVDVPPPGQSMPAEIPAPGQVAAPEPEPAYEPVQQAAAPEPAAKAPASVNEDGDIYTGGQAFDPSAGLIADTGGDIAPRKSTGLALTALAGGIAVGALLGFLGADLKNKSAMKERATAKAAEMLTEVQRVSQTRKEISLAFEDVVKKIDTKPEEGVAELAELLVKSFGPDSDFPKVETLFGWQLSSLHPKSVKDTFALYKASQDLVVDMGYMTQYVNANGDAIKGRGPTSYAVVPKEGAGVLVEFVGFACGEGEEMAACEAGKEGEATGVQVREAPGGPVGVLPSEGVIVVAPQGPIYQYAIGDHPEQNAANLYKGLAARVQERLDAMAKYEDRAIEALSKYSDNPTTDDESAQPDPG